VARPRAVFDASVVVRAVVDAADDARSWIESLGACRVDVAAPDLIYAEVANALVQCVRQGRLELERVVALLAAIVELPLDVKSNRALCGIACSVAVEAGLSAYDAHYLALAEAEGAVLVTADRRLAEAASQSILLA
jgi:predicted nucleic acid-binding protein